MKEVFGGRFVNWIDEKNVCNSIYGSEGDCPGVIAQRWLSGGDCPGVIIQGVIIQEVIVQGLIVRGIVRGDCHAGGEIVLTPALANVR